MMKSTNSLTVYRESLSREGFELETAISGVECVARLRERVPDVLLLEPRMPWGGSDGVLAMMEEIPQLATVPVIILTSCHDPDVLHRVACYLISDYYLKPLAPDRLVEKLRSVLNHPRLRFTLAERGGVLESDD
jgi:DNA-binding NtrC family response regulator